MVNDTLADELERAAEIDAFNPDARMAAMSIFEAQERVFTLVPRIMAAIRRPAEQIAESANCPLPADVVGVVERLQSLRNRMGLLFSGEFVESALITLDATAYILTTLAQGRDYYAGLYAERCGDLLASGRDEVFDNPSDDLNFILGQPCFTFIRHARAWRASGHKIATRAESEQAFFIGRMLHHYFAAPTNWREKWGEEIESVIALIPTPPQGDQQ